MRSRALGLWLVLLLAACAPAVQRGAPLAVPPFATWQSQQTADTFLRPEGDSYRITSRAPYAWQVVDVPHGDVWIEATFAVLSDDMDNGYGVACRVERDFIDNDGYYVMLSSDGFYGIFWRFGKDFIPLRDWRIATSIRQGKATNTLRIACLRETPESDRIYVWINDIFEASVSMSTRGLSPAPSAQGLAAVVAHIYGAGEVDVRVTNLQIYQAHR